MNARQRKKYLDMGAECSHRLYSRFMVTDDPYPIYDVEDECKLGRFYVRHGSSNDCLNCKHYTLSKKSMKDVREWDKEHKRFIRGLNNYTINIDSIL